MTNFYRAAIALLFLLPISGVFGQDDLLQQLQTENKKPEYVIATFKSTRLINQHTSQLVGKGTLEFKIQHRFGKLTDLSTFFGLDQARIRIGLTYGATDWLDVGIGRSTQGQVVDGSLKFRIARQRQGKTWPWVSVTWMSNMGISAQKWDGTPERPDIFSNRLSFVNQLIIARKFGERFSLQLLPTHIHYNLVPTKYLYGSGPAERSRNSIFVLGIGGRLKLSKRVALTAEYNWIPPGQVRGYYDSFALGCDIETGGHVFQLFFANSRDMIEQQFMARNSSKIWKSDIYFGFNISRVFSLLKPKEFRKKKGKDGALAPETAPKPTW
jgi:hypothetical protein